MLLQDPEGETTNERRQERWGQAKLLHETFIGAEDVALLPVQLTTYLPEHCPFLQIEPLQWSRATHEQPKQEECLSPFTATGCGES